MATFVSLTATTLYGVSWTGTAPGPANPTVSGTVASSTDYSDHIKSVSISLDAAEVDFTNFGSGGFKEMKTGLLTAGVQISFFGDAAASGLDSVLFAALTARTLTYWDFKPTSSARGASNASLVFALYVKKYPAAWTIGSAQEASVDFSIAGKYARLTA
jgi:hypothetical protein